MDSSPRRDELVIEGIDGVVLTSLFVFDEWARQVCSSGIGWARTSASAGAVWRHTVTAGLLRMPSRDGLASQAGILGVGRLVAAGVQALSFALLARSLGPSLFGEFAAAYGVAVVCQAVFAVGLGQFVVSRRAEDSRAFPHASVEVVTALRMGQLVTAGMLGTIAFATVVVYALWSASTLVLMILLAWVVVDNWAEQWLAISLADRRAYENSAITVLRRVVAISILLIAYAVDINTGFAYGVGLLLGSLTAAVLAVALNRRRVVAGLGFGWDSQVFRSLTGYWANSVVTQLRNLDTALFGLFGGSGVSVGLYGAASRLTTPLRILPTAFSAVLMPHAARVGRESWRELSRPVLGIWAISALLFGATAAVAPLVTVPLLGADYEGAVVPIQIVCAGLVFGAGASQLSSILLGWRLTRVPAVAAAVATTFCFAGVVATAAFGFGAAMAASALAFSYVLQFSILCMFAFAVLRRTEGGA